MIEVLTSDLKAHDRVLVKGSRGMKLRSRKCFNFLEISRATFYL